MPAMVEPKYERKRELKEKQEVEGSKRMRVEEDRTVLLNTGARMPLVQFGTYKLKGEESYKVTLGALRQGYRGLDTATCYDNEKQVGRAILDSGVVREQLYIQTKLWRSYVGKDSKTGKPRCDAWLKKISQTPWSCKTGSVADALARPWPPPQLPPSQDGHGPAQAGQAREQGQDGSAGLDSCHAAGDLQVHGRPRGHHRVSSGRL